MRFKFHYKGGFPKVLFNIHKEHQSVVLKTCATFIEVDANNNYNNLKITEL
jgi:hypothetical protein